MASILIIHQNAFLREGIKQFIEKEHPQFNVTTSGVLADHSLDGLKAEDLVMIDGSSAEPEVRVIIERLLKSNIRTAVWLPSENEEFCRIMLEKKCSGYLSADTDYDDLKYAFSVLLKNKTYVHHDLIPFLYKLTELGNITFDQLPSRILTRREWEVLQLLADGHNNKSISVRLFVSESTVKNHLSSIMRKLKVNDRTAAVIKALRNNWVS